MKIYGVPDIGLCHHPILDIDTVFAILIFAFDINLSLKNKFCKS